MQALSPTVWYRLGEPSGTSAADASGNTNTGTYVGTPTLGSTGLITGDSDKAVTLGSGQYVTGPVVTLPTTEITLGGWANITSIPSDGALVGRWGANSGAMLYMDATKVYLYVNGTNSCNVNKPSAARHSYIATWDGTNARIYIDGALAAGPTAYAGPITQPAATNLQVGTYANHGGGNILGVVDEPFMVGRAITAAEVTTTHNASNGVFG